MKKPSLSTIKDALARKGCWICPVTGNTIKTTLSGFFSVQKAGVTRLYMNIRDAWMAL